MLPPRPLKKKAFDLPNLSIVVQCLNHFYCYRGDHFYYSASLQELRFREEKGRVAAAKAREAERVQRMPKNRERVGFREERSRQKRVGIDWVSVDYYSLPKPKSAPLVIIADSEFF